MNKYDEALIDLLFLNEWILGLNISDSEAVIQSTKLSRYVSILRELVNRATPMKPINVEKDYAGLIGECPRCNWWCDSFSLNDGVNYCQVCGQALDWSGETK